MYYNRENLRHNLLFSEASEDVLFSIGKCAMFSRFVVKSGGPLLKPVPESDCN